MWVELETPGLVSWIGEYLKGYLKPYPVMAPLTILEELIKPFTLALRLFCNMFAGHILLVLLVGWRGEPGKTDEPQHVKQGKVTQAVFDAMTYSGYAGWTTPIAAAPAVRLPAGSLVDVQA